MGARRALPLLACILGLRVASAGRLQVGRRAQQVAKGRFVREAAGLARALRSGLGAQRQAPELMAELARERLGQEADGLEPAGAALLRAFVGGAPDSVLVSPVEAEEVESPGDQGFAVMEGPRAMPAGEGFAVVEGPAGGAMPEDQGFAVVEGPEAMPGGQGAMVVEASDGEGAPEVELSVPSFLNRGAEGAQGVQGLLRQDAVAHAARSLASEMQAIEDTLGREVLQQIVGEYFSDAARRAEQAGEMAAIEAWQHRQAMERSFGHAKSKGAIAEHPASAGGSDRRHVRLWPEVRSGGTPAPNATKPGSVARNKTAPAVTIGQNKSAVSAAMVERAAQVSDVSREEGLGRGERPR